MDYSSEVPDEFLVQALSQLKSIAIGSVYAKLLSKTSELLTIRRILFKANNDIPWGKRKYHQLLQQTSAVTCNHHQKKLKQHNQPSVDGRTRLTLCSNPNIINSSSSRQVTYIFDNNSTSSSESSCSFSRNHVVQKFTECSVVNKCEPDPDVVMLQDLSDDSSGISKELSSSCKTVWQSSEESVRSQDAQVYESSIDITHISTSTRSGDTVNSAETPCPKHEPLRRSNRLTSFVGDRLQEAVVPIGDHFQASIPDCIGPLCYEYDLDNSKWLGETIWPRDNKYMDTDMEIIGKGRSDSSLCSCIDRDSSDCIKLHIQEKKVQLQFEIGDAYYLWDFERMGEEVSKLWTLEEGDRFKNLYKRKTSMSKERFWKQIIHLFPDKRRENIVSYYFNVFALNNIKKQATIRCHVIDSVDDEPNNNDSASEGKKRTWLC